MAPNPSDIDNEAYNLSNRFEEVKDPLLYLQKHDALCKEAWEWSETDKSYDASLHGDDNKAAVTFHPFWSNGTAGIRANRPLVGDINYWEIHIGDRIFGTSLMFGVTTQKARLQANDFKNMIGEDIHGWGLSHRGRTHHNGMSSFFCRSFPEHTPTIVGILLDRRRGDMSFYKDGVCLGQEKERERASPFQGLDRVESDLYPTICSTAAKSAMMVGTRYRSFLNLQDRCRHVVAGSVLAGCEFKGDRVVRAQELPVPRKMKDYITMVL
ncbi:SPRY domain-containing SOCS box protein 3 [Aplysia californica]|uniref:SPRY domain-containing SOCS box protein 3 n=1 Tax=Aplysia californica TaxID=6500 RepID=A0ABM1AEW5_APLCA|nr:SPRY domain-containing SOCS box protein 3 [Aplysia californica]